MEFERYRPESHNEILMDWFVDKASEPIETEGYRRAVEEVYQDFQGYFGLDRDIDFVFAETDMEFLQYKYDEVPVHEYAMDFSADPDYHDVESPTVFLMATKDYEHWENILKFVGAHELAHQKYYENRDVGWKIYQRMLFEGHAMHSAEELSSEKNYGWTQEGWTPGQIKSEDLLEELDKFNKWKNQEDVEVSGLFVPGGDNWLEAEGYPATFELAAYILEKEDMNAQDLLEIEEKIWKKELKNAIREIYKN